MQHIYILTEASSDETSVYKTPPEVQKSEVMIGKQEQVSRFLHIAPQRLHDLKCPEKYISATWKMSNISGTSHHKHCHRPSTPKLMTSLLEDRSATIYVYLYEYIDVYAFIFIWILLFQENEGEMLKFSSDLKVCVVFSLFSFTYYSEENRIRAAR